MITPIMLCETRKKEKIGEKKGREEFGELEYLRIYENIKLNTVNLKC